MPKSIKSILSHVPDPLLDGFHTYTWDAEGNPISISNYSTVTFDALDRQVERTFNGGINQIDYGPWGERLGIMNGQTLSWGGRLELPGEGFAVYGSGPTLAGYTHPDWEGSLRVMSSSSAPTSVTADGALAPFGEYYSAGGNARPLFAQLPNDTYLDMGDGASREYQTTQSRWISPDPAGMAAANPANPQPWNRYAYALNNPLAGKGVRSLFC